MNNEMKKRKIYILLFLPLLIAACSVQPDPIDYGSDLCHYCKMTIVDRQHAAELVTSKGKARKYDAIECMINDWKASKEETDFAFLLVCDYTAPGELIDGRESRYLISPNIPSPMGAFLSAFPDQVSAQQLQAEKGGEIYDWPQITEEITGKDLMPHE